MLEEEGLDLARYLVPTEEARPLRARILMLFVLFSSVGRSEAGGVG
jgi:hypothetical protein